ncbi:class I SAM-dependent methyltransferase [Desulfopila sp. IMCC35008]|uniref:class I SAM-dependent methyltransferase n=1 Tax=Desulfopila sp. IMCC35008 TaxID=2653858 RepID=UPI0013CF4EAF|nr:class I SAM-dependent methyltransferase [Desulfopila sp. IMCC35008]
MTDFSKITYDDLDWAELWHNARDIKGWSNKGAKEWDKKSESFAVRNRDSVFASLLLPHLPLGPETSVLDIGCGPGTLALPIAKHCKTVTALDFSAKMLQLLDQRAAEDNIKNIRTVQCAWEDDWQKARITAHDITIAARSMGVEDLQGAIDKLQRYSKKHIFIADRISPTPFDPEVFRALGRPFESGPDYIYTLNMLYSMGIHPETRIMQLESEVTFANLDDALTSYSWMIKELQADEERKLRAYVEGISRIDTDGSVTIKRDPPPRWVLIHWTK